MLGYAILITLLTLAIMLIIPPHLDFSAFFLPNYLPHSFQKRVGLKGSQIMGCFYFIGILISFINYCLKVNLMNSYWGSAFVIQALLFIIQRYLTTLNVRDYLLKVFGSLFTKSKA